MLVWMFQVGPAWQFNFTPLVFPVHLALDAYAFFSRDMFEMTPAARRAGERAAVDDLPTAVLIVDDDDRIVELNGEARRVLGVEEESVLGRPLAEHVPAVDPEAGSDSVSITVGGSRREYAVTTSPIEDDGGTRVAGTIVMQDVTEERRREQRLAVLNRVLRHNLRNDLGIVAGYFETANERTDDDVLPDLHAAAHEKTLDVIDLAEKARDVERAVGGDGDGGERFGVADLLEDVREDLTGKYDGDVRIEAPDDVALVADEVTVDRVFRNLIENGLEHGGDKPVVTVRFAGVHDTGRARLAISDDGPGIPDHELAVIETGEETALEHGSGLGLWLVKWGVASLGGEVRFETDESGTTVVVELPGATGTAASR